MTDETTQRLRSAVLTGLLVLAAVTAGGAAAAAPDPAHQPEAAASPAAATTGSTSIAASTTGASTANVSGGVAFAYVDTSTSQLTLVGADGASHVVEESTTAEILGPPADLDDDPALEVPYVDSSGTVYVNDRTGEEVALTDSQVADKQLTRLATADWDGDGHAAVVYVNTTTDGADVYRVEPSTGERARVLDPASPAQAVLGVGQFDGDGGADLVYATADYEVKYLDRATGDVETTNYTSVGADSNGLGVGTLTDFDGDGQARLPVVDGENDVVLLAANGSTTTVAGGADKAPVATVDWVGDARQEILYVGASSGQIRYAALDGSTGAVRVDNNTVSPADSAGIAGAPNRGAARNVDSSVQEEPGATPTDSPGSDSAGTDATTTADGTAATDAETGAAADATITTTTPGFTALLGVVAVVGAALLAARRD
ncbi:PGF-CTERM sorting domain-containing protein [Halobaculum sp. D14]|uniref:PGF-CTERM sorting domain-containing protein n=1 Tax=unclassified Halobaculum TaxID=2640896 RepID=UPI003EBFE1C8